MHIKSLFLVASAILLAACRPSQPLCENETYVRWVNPMIGTDYTGNTYPGAQAPFGMVQLSPDNGLPGWDRIAGYYYPDSTIAGFSHTHLSGTGAGDLYDISFMPVTLPYREAEAPLGIHSRFLHEDEEAYAGYYRVKLLDYGIGVELTATPRCGLQRYTFPAGKAAVFLNLQKAMNWDRTTNSDIEVVDSVTIRGYRFSEGWARGQRLYFYTRFSRPFLQSEVTRNDIVQEGKAVGRGTVARFDFQMEEGGQVVLSTALSCVSMEGAERNLQAEVGTKGFDDCLAGTEASWNRELGKIEIDTDDDDLRKVFYTALYHSMLAPTLYGDVDGAYYGPDRQVHRAEGWENYSTFSLWDTFRAAHPLFTCIQPERTNDMVKSLIAFYRQHGRLPVWNLQGSETDMMIGYHAVAVIADAYLKGIGDFDADEALEACVATATADDYRGIGLYREKGYVPCDVADSYNADNWSLSRTLEYAFDDWCIAQLARQRGREELAREFERRSKNFRNVFNCATGFMQPRDSKGAFVRGFSPDDYTPHICESNGWQYLWSVQHDVEGLITLCGGRERFEQKLDSMFTYRATEEELPIFSTGMIGQYAHGNEPSHHVAYLYNYTDAPWKGADRLQEIMRTLYTNTPGGLCGNEDCGQMSAWYVFSAMGFYPVNPASGRYELGTPLFPRSVVHMPGGKRFTVIARNLSRENRYIQKATLDGKPYDARHITHRQMAEGSTLVLEMGAAHP